MTVIVFNFAKPISGYFGFPTDHPDVKEPDVGQVVQFTEEDADISHFTSINKVFKFEDLATAYFFFEGIKCSVFPLSYEDTCKEYRAKGYDVGCPYTFVGW